MNSVAETGNDNSYPTGVYRHRETGEELICLATSKFGNPQAAAATRVGFEYAGPVKGEDKKTVEALVDPHAAPSATPMGVKTVAELEAELAEAKLRESEFVTRRKEAEAQQSAQEKKTAEETIEREKARQVQTETQTKSEEKILDAKKTLGKDTK